MQTVLIVVHLIIVLALVGVVLLQRSEGGGLGIGGGNNSFMSARGAANALSKMTTYLAAAFFATSLALGILASNKDAPTDILDRIPTTQGNGVLDQLGGNTPAAPAASDIPQPTDSSSPVPDTQ